jgi:hypothetical protein
VRSRGRRRRFGAAAGAVKTELSVEAPTMP